MSILLGLATGSVGTWAIMHPLSSSGEGDVIEPCPGRCLDAELNGTFMANVSRSKSVFGTKIWVRFLVTHHFNSTSRTGTVHVDPYQSPFSLLQPFTCTDVPVRVASGCNLSFVSDCTREADKKNDVVGWAYRWDGGDMLQVAETISTPFFKDRYVWMEQRANATIAPAPAAHAGTRQVAER